MIVSIRDRQGQFCAQVQGEGIGKGLAVHKSSLKGWNVAHLKTGCAVHTGFKTRDKARKFGRLIRKLTDWTQSSKVLRKCEGIIQEVNKAIGTVEGKEGKYKAS